MRRARVLAGPLVVLLVGTLALALGGVFGEPVSPAAASPTATIHTINGTWRCCGAGGAGAQNWVIDNNGGVGLTPGGSQFATLQVSYNWPSVGIETIYTNSTYTATFDGTITNNATVMSGTWTSNENQSGTWTAMLSGAPPPTTVPPTTAPPTTVPPPPNHNVEPAPIASSIGTPGEVFHSVPHDLANAVITVGAILFITFPANIFNQTFSANYDEILLIMAGGRRRARRLIGRRDTPATPPSSTPSVHPDDAPPTTVATATATPGRTTAWWFGAVLVVGAVLGGLLNPAFGFNGTSAASVAATLLAFAFGATISWFVAHRFRTYHQYGTHTYLKALPLGLGIAALCVLVSRVSNFQPGYLYGIVVSVAFAESLADRHNAHLTAISTISTLSISLSAWFLWIPVNHVALDHPSVLPLAIVDDLLGSIFIGGLVGTVIGLFPLTLMPGRTLMSWRRDAWAALLFLSLFLLIEVELRPESGPTHSGGSPWVTVLVLFVIFGGGTVAMRLFFAHRTPPSPSTTTTPAADTGSNTATVVASRETGGAESAAEPGGRGEDAPQS